MSETGEIQAHENTYEGFIRMLKVSTALVALVTIFVIGLIAS
ncbi:MAG: aa3-type cytochrome c oxidase subunit IV [Pseudomonadota bacterium]